MTITKWDIRHMRVAKEMSTRSVDPSTKVGAIAVKDNIFLSEGWNGFPRGILDSPERLNDREVKYDLVVHAEQNVIFNAARNGRPLLGASLYCYGLPICNTCAKGIIQSGISKVFMVAQDIDKRPAWKDSWLKTRDMFAEAGVEYNFINNELLV